MATAIGRLQGSMIGPDGKQTCLVVTLHPEALGELKQVLGSGQRRIFRDNIPPGVLRRLIQQAGVPLAEVHLGGPPVEQQRHRRGRGKNVDSTGRLVSGLLGLGLAWWSLRSIALTIIVFSCVLKCRYFIGHRGANWSKPRCHFDVDALFGLRARHLRCSAPSQLLSRSSADGWALRFGRKGRSAGLETSRAVLGNHRSWFTFSVGKRVSAD